MKIKIVEQKDNIKPSLYINNDNTVIILAIMINGYLVGTVCYSKNNEYEIGFYDMDWDKNSFHLFNGKVILSNE